MFETLPDIPVAVNRPRTSTAIYRAMDKAAWPTTIPKLTEAEAKKAAQLLYRKFYENRWYQERHGMSRAAYLKQRGSKLPTRKLVPVKVTSGRRYNDLRQGTIYVNPERGWHALVHELGHDFHAKLYPNRPGHGDWHRHLEREMIEYVVKSGWLDGKLVPKPRAPRPPKPAVAKPDPLIADHEKAVAKVKAWKTRLRRAKTGLANAQKAELKLRRKRQRQVRFSLSD